MGHRSGICNSKYPSDIIGNLFDGYKNINQMNN